MKRDKVASNILGSEMQMNGYKLTAGVGVGGAES